MSLEKDLSQFALSGPELEHLRAAGQIVIPHLNSVLDRFYTRLMAEPDMARHFTSQQIVDHARKAQLIHWRRLLSATIDAEYARSVDTIGRTHARLDLPIEDYMSAYALAATDLFGVLMRQGNRGLFRRDRGLANLAAAMNRAFSFDIAQVTRATVNYWNEEQQAAIAHLEAALGALSSGNLTYRISNDEASGFPVRFQPLRAQFNSALDRLEQMMQDTTEAVEDLLSQVDRVNGASDEMSERTNSQAAALEQTAAALEQIVQTVTASTENIAQINDVTNTAKSRVHESVDVVRHSQGAMQRIKEASDKIGKITSLIDDIAFQTNLLALNAGVEAARAGEAGRGFAVVASEVRNLASNSSKAAKDIKDLIMASASEVDSGVELVATASATLDETSSNFADLTHVAAQIKVAATEQSQAITEVNASVSHLDRITQNNAAMVEETTGSMRNMQNSAHRIQSLLAGFHLGKTGSSSRPQNVVRQRTALRA